MPRLHPSQLSPVPTLLPLASSITGAWKQYCSSPDLGLNVSSTHDLNIQRSIRSWRHIGIVHVLPINIRPNFNLFQQNMERTKEPIKLFILLYLGGICPHLQLPALLLKVLIHTQ
jgi:hypothetical protein